MRMRILWFVNTPFPAVCKHFAFPAPAKGWWLVSMAEALCKTDTVELAVAWVSSTVSHFSEFTEGGVHYFCVPATDTKLAHSKISKIMHYLQICFFVFKNSYQPCNETTQKYCQQIVKQFCPDIVHVNGSENYYGLLTSFITKPVIISLQGILTSYVKEFWGGVTFGRRFFYIRDQLSWLEMKHNANREREIFKRNYYFAGRTLWDRSQQYMLCPNGKYFSDCGEVLRAQFYQSQWKLEHANKYSIYITTTSRPYKGLDVLIDALAILHNEFPCIQLRVGGSISENGYGEYVRKKVQEYRLEEAVHFLGYVNTEQIIQELLQAHAYVLPSFVENSPNSLAEAQAVGVPSVASYAGSSLKRYRIQSSRQIYFA